VEVWTPAAAGLGAGGAGAHAGGRGAGPYQGVAADHQQAQEEEGDATISAKN